MSPPLPDSGPEREIFIAALRHFSDTCETPMLQPECPFATPTDPGTRGCGEECMDLLAEYQADSPPGLVRLGEGWAVHPRRRPRRGPEPTARPFDAKEIHLKDCENKDLSAWRSVALLFEVRQLVSSSPTRDPDSVLKRRERLDDCIAELDRRGYDAELVVREGMGRTIAVSIALAIVMPSVVRANDPTAPELETLEAPEGWADLFDLALAADSSVGLFASAPEPLRRLLVGTQGDFHRRVSSWVLSTPFDDVLDWVAPSYEGLVQLPATDFSNIGPANQWIVDRGLTTYLSDWSTTALHAEWEYLHALRLPPCPPKEMVARRVDVNKLALEIAERAVPATPERLAAEAGFITPASYTRYAVRLIGEGRRSAAAAIFEATRDVAPQNATAHNNFGFCILPDRPADALAAFERAFDLGDTDAVNYGNRMYALMTLGRNATALEIAERFADRYNEMPANNGWMWDFNAHGGEPALVDLDDVRVYVLDLALHIAELTKDDALIVQWARRRAELRGEGN